MCVSYEKIQELYWLEHWHFLDSFISYWSTHSFVTHTTITLRINNSQTARFRRSRAAFPLPHHTLRGPRNSNWQIHDRQMVVADFPSIAARETNSPANIFDTDLSEVLIPLPSRRPLIINEFHESTIGGHQGDRKLFHRIRETFYWSHMGKKIGNFVLSCSNCQRNKILSAKTKQPMRLTNTPKRVFEKVQMDMEKRKRQKYW